MDRIKCQTVQDLVRLSKGVLVIQKTPTPLSNQNGSVILITMMILVCMTVIGLISSRTAMTEHYILRNQSIYKQNINMVESAIMECFQRFMQRDFDDQDIANVTSSSLVWVNNSKDTWADVDWYKADYSSALLLNAGNSMNISTPQPLTDRGETATGNLRTGFLGWDIVTHPSGGSESLGIGSNTPVWRKGRIIGEYGSRTTGGTDHGYGMLRMEIGLKRRIVIY